MPNSTSTRIPIYLISFLFLTSTNLHAKTITEHMQHQLPSIIQFLNEKDIQNVGVLKFRVRKAASDDISASVGPINSLLADRLELGLILALSLIHI